MIFKRNKLTFRKAQLFSLAFYFEPVEEITLDDSGITFAKKEGRYEYQWNEILSVELRKIEFQHRPLHSPGLPAYGNKKLLIIKTLKQSFSFSVAGNFSDFENGGLLLSELQKRYKVSETQYKSRMNGGWSIFIVILFALLDLALIKAGHIIGGLMILIPVLFASDIIDSFNLFLIKKSKR